MNISTEVRWTHTKEFYEKNSKIHALIIALIILELVLGFLIKGILGLAIGISLSIATYILGPDAVTKVREITRG